MRNKINVHKNLKCIPGAVGGGADLVRDADTAFSRERLGVLRVKLSAELSSSVLQAVADGLAVSGSGCGVQQILNSATAHLRRTLTSLNVAQARH